MTTMTARDTDAGILSTPPMPWSSEQPRSHSVATRHTCVSPLRGVTLQRIRFRALPPARQDADDGARHSGEEGGLTEKAGYLFLIAALTLLATSGGIVTIL